MHPPIPTSCSSSSSSSVDGNGEGEVVGKERLKQRRDQLSLLALVVTLFRKSFIVCKSDRREVCAMEIGWPTDVRHVTHVTFDRFNGFLGLPVEFEPEVPRRAPSARYVFIASALLLLPLVMPFLNSDVSNFSCSCLFLYLNSYLFRLL